MSWQSGSPCSDPNSSLLLLPARGESDITASSPDPDMSSPHPDSDPGPLSSLAGGSGVTCGSDLLLCADMRDCADSMGVSGAGSEPMLPRLCADSVTLPEWKQLDHMLMKPPLQPAESTGIVIMQLVGGGCQQCRLGLHAAMCVL